MPDYGVIEETCTHPGCDEPRKARGLCISHYQKFRRQNPGLIRRYGPRTETPLERVQRNIVVNPETGCWEKLGHVSNQGYGQVRIGKKFYLMHRLAYEAVVGPIPEGMVLDHLCRNTRCSNPDHLEAVTQKENVARGLLPGAKWREAQSA